MALKTRSRTARRKGSLAELVPVCVESAPIRCQRHTIHTCRQTTTHIQSKVVAGQKHAKVWIVPEHRMSSHFPQKDLQTLSALLDKVTNKPANGMLLRRWGHNAAGVVAAEGVVEPQEVIEASEDRACGRRRC